MENIELLEKMEYLIRTLTYKRSCIECDLRDNKHTILIKFKLQGEIEGLSMAITEIYKMIQ